jgi:hypothetical protein
MVLGEGLWVREGLTMSEFAVRPLAWVPPSMTLTGSISVVNMFSEGRIT